MNAKYAIVRYYLIDKKLQRRASVLQFQSQRKTNFKNDEIEAKSTSRPFYQMD
jgi:hypothetical protein